ncbi:MAG TPA: DNA-binding protein [Prolixibacteraceae bacterium]|nr:DNA-binding protein [Prolixibacteraceae bacterium]
MSKSELSKRVKELRSRKGLSQEQLAENSGLSLRTIQRIENGETEPRGETLKRLMNALDAAPDDIMDWNIVEDKGFLTALNLSALGFLFFPLLGILIPLILWISKKDKVKNVNEMGKAILNFQITWVLILSLIYFLLISGILSRLEWFGNITSYLGGGKLIFAPILLYAYNSIFILVNTIFVYKGLSVKYFPSIRFLR